MKTTRRNLLFVLTDQQQRDALGCMGNPNIETPHLDQLAREGVLFRRCYSNNPVCTPFRGSLLTGQYTSRCGVMENNAPLPAGVPTFADAFNRAGYATSWIGK
jgi:N-acetylglucosamine-6-sulfatase